MKVQCFSDPTLLDFAMVANDMPDDERRQVEAFSGLAYDAQRIAADNFLIPGPKWVMKAGDLPLCAGGYIQVRNGVWRDYMLTTAAAWAPEHWLSVTRFARKIMNSMFTAGVAHRLECITTAERYARPELAKWYKILGLHYEGTHHGYCASGADAVTLARVKH
jgi:hypothetical protein